MKELYLVMIGTLRQLSEPRLRQLAGIRQSHTAAERDILVQWVRKRHQKTVKTSLLPYLVRSCQLSKQWIPQCNRVQQ